MMRTVSYLCEACGASGTKPWRGKPYRFCSKKCAAKKRLTGAVSAFRPFSPEEDEAIRAGYQIGAIADLAATLDRTVNSVRARAIRLGLNLRRKWTAPEETLLRNSWGLLSLRSLVKRLNRTPQAIYVRAERLGLIKEAREGVETMTEAALRTGFGRDKLIAILREHNALAQAESRYSMKYKPTPMYRLDPFDVDEAVAAHLERETVGAAARRRGMDKRTVMRALERIGVRKPPQIAKRHRWLIDGETIERALAGRSA